MTQCAIITLPWYPPELQPNNRKQLRYCKDIKNKYKSDCGTCALERRVKFEDGKNIPLTITFYPPTTHKRDLDNCLASFKYGIDGIALSWGVNDVRFHPITIDWGHEVEHGKITVEAWGVV